MTKSHALKHVRLRTVLNRFTRRGVLSTDPIWGRGHDVTLTNCRARRPLHLPLAPLHRPLAPLHGTACRVQLRAERRKKDEAHADVDRTRCRSGGSTNRLESERDVRTSVFKRSKPPPSLVLNSGMQSLRYSDSTVSVLRRRRRSAQRQLVYDDTLCTRRQSRRFPQTAPR